MIIKDDQNDQQKIISKIEGQSPKTKGTEP